MRVEDSYESGTRGWVEVEAGGLQTLGSRHRMLPHHFCRTFKLRPHKRLPTILALARILKQ